MRITTTAGKTSMALLIALALSHFFNDMLQAIITAVYPLLKSDMALSFAQIGAITLCYQTSASVFQPVMGMLLDKKPNPYFLPLGMTFTYSGLTILAFSDSYAVILFSVSLVGLGSSILHPEASRLTSLASGGKRGFAQSVFQVGGNTLYIGARACAKSITPSPYLQRFRSNHIQWDNEFGFTYRFMGGATVAYPTQWVKPMVDFSFENRTNPIYVSASDWKPRQYKGSVQIMTGTVGLDITTPWINLENKVVIQHTTNDSVLPAPLVILQHRLYYHGSWFRHAMDAQMGVDLRYFTRYHAPVLCPATGLFATQQETNIGNYPWMSVYANFYVRSIRLRFFAHYQHLNHLFMKKNINYLAMPGYPTNRDVFRAGLAWHFYN